MGDDGPMCPVSREHPPPRAPRKGSQVAVLANPAARRGRAADDLDGVLARLRTHGIEPLVLDSGSADEALAAARHAVEIEIPRLVAVGGDGIVHLAADATAGSGTVLGVVAAGTGNDFAGALDLDRGDLANRVDRALTDPVAVDVVIHSDPITGTHPTSHAATVCIAGFPATVNARAEAMDRPRGPSRYTLATILAIGGMRPAQYRLTCRGGPDDGRIVEQRCAVVAVANTGLFGGGMRICPDARPDDGLLDVCLVGDVGRIALLRAFPKVRTGAHLDHPAVTVLRTAEVDLELVDPEPSGETGADRLRADGEPFGSLPSTLAVRPGALWVAGAVPEPVGRS